MDGAVPVPLSGASSRNSVQEDVGCPGGSRVDVGIYFRSCSQMSFALPSRWRSGHIRADSQVRIPVGLFRTNLERWISTGSSHRFLVKDGKHAVAKTQYLGRASAIHARTERE